MERRGLFVIAIIGVMSVLVFGQASLTGKWQTDNAQAALEAQKNAPTNPAPEAGGRGRGRGGGFGPGGQPIIMDLKVDVLGRITGTVNEIGNGDPLMIESGSIKDKTITLVTQPRGVTWNVEMTDDNTITVVSRVFAGGGFGRRGPGVGTPPVDPAPGGGAGAGGGGGRGGRGAPPSIVLHRAK